MVDDHDLIELYEERCAIREFDGGMDRIEAERAAYFDLRKLVGSKVKMPEYIRQRAALGRKGE